MWEDQRIVARDALPRPGLRAALRRAPGADLRACTSTSASTTPTRRSTSPTGCASTCRCCSRCQRQLAVLARRRDRAALDAHADLPRVPARRACRRATATGPTTSAQIDFMVAQRRDGGLHLPLVRRAPAPELRHRRDPRAATRRPASSTRSALAALIQAMVKELCEHFDDGQHARATTRGRCSTRTSGWPRATASTASSSTCRPPSASRRKALARRLLDRLREHAAGPRLGRRARGHRRPAGPRQRRRAPARRLRGQPRPPRGHGRDRRATGDGDAEL